MVKSTRRRFNHTTDYECPHCGAAPGEPCTAPSGAEVYSHTARPRGYLLADLTPAAYAAWEEMDADPFTTEVISPTEFIIH